MEFGEFLNLKLLKLEKYLKVLSIEDKVSDKNQKPFQVVRFKEYLGEGKVAFKKARTENLWGEGEFEGKVIPAHSLFGELYVGALVPGAIESYKTTPYRLEGNPVELTETTIIVFDGENGLAKAAKLMSRNNAGIVLESGEIVFAKKSAPKADAPVAPKVDAPASKPEPTEAI